MDSKNRISLEAFMHACFYNNLNELFFVVDPFDSKILKISETTGLLSNISSNLHSCIPFYDAHFVMESLLLRFSASVSRRLNECQNSLLNVA